MSGFGDQGEGSWKTELRLDGSVVHTMTPPSQKVLLWHVTANCNMNCRYCYGSFGGSSYRDSRRENIGVEFGKLVEAARDLAGAGFRRAHICGGEPFLFPELWKFLSVLKSLDIDRCVLTNGTFLPNGFESALEQELFTSLSFSLDAVSEAINDSVRGNTAQVIRTIKKILRLREKLGVRCEIGMYAVLTRVNLDSAKELLDAIREWGVDFATVQICYLPKTHAEYESLSLNPSLSAFATDVLSKLYRMKDINFRVPGLPFFKLSEAALTPGTLAASNCFADRGQFLFIDAEGNVRPCATREGGSCIIGNIYRQRLKDFIGNADRGECLCDYVCADCIGAWEMAHPLDATSNFDRSARSIERRAP